MSISIKPPEDIAGLRIAGRLAAELLDYLTPFVKPGVSTGELDRLAYDYTVNVQGCIPACLGYCPPGMTPYPATTCISINHVVCHGIPSDKKILKTGDIVNIDVTSIKNGYHGDTSRMFVVGKPTIAGKRLVDLAFGTMWAGIDAVRPGGCFNDIGRACQAYADANGISVVRDYGGHGIGKGFHEEPHVNHFPVNRPTPKFEPGMVFTVEPMVNAGRYGVTMLNDGWTVVTKDHSLSAQWEHMVLVTETGYDVLTVSKGTLPPPAFVKGWHLPENLYTNSAVCRIPPGPDQGGSSAHEARRPPFSYPLGIHPLLSDPALCPTNCLPMLLPASCALFKPPESVLPKRGASIAPRTTI